MQPPLACPNPDAAARLARDHDASTLAVALVERLRVEGRGALADAIVATMPEHAPPAEPLIGSTPPHPHEPSE